jgi:DNA-binding NarL/FixJ family response regulator
MSRIAVVIADDHPVVRRGLRQILEDTTDIVVVGEAGSAPEAVDHARRGGWDVMLLDLTMPGGSGLDVLEAVRRERPDRPVLVLSIHPEDQFGVRVLKGGAAGYMTKESAPEELVRAIRKVHGGGRYVTPRVAEKLALDVQSGSGGLPHELLSNREYEVLCLLAKARSVKEIGKELKLSEKTVSTYRARLLGKLQMRTTADLIRYAIQNRLVD